MRRFLFLSLVLCLLIVPASAQQPNAPIGSTLPRPDPGSSAFCRRPCQRLLLTDAKKTELNARRVANTAEWQANKAYADLIPADWPGLNQTTLGGALGTGGTGTTFTVADGSAFPADATQYRIDLELITATRSGNTLTVVSRGDRFGAGAVSLGAQSHASGAEIWQHMALGDWGSYFGPITAVMEHAGQSGYEQRARMALGQLLLAYASIPDGRYNGNTIRWPWWAIPITYDWVYEHLSANEIGVYAPVIADALRWHVTNMKFCIGACVSRQGLYTASSVANIGNGQIRAILAGAAAIAGDVGEAHGLWADGYRFYNDYMIPAMAHGAFSGGNTPEGSEYITEVWAMGPAILDVVESAIGEDSWARVPGWDLQYAKYVLYATQPGAARHQGGEYTYGTIGVGSTSMTVAGGSENGVASFSVGDNIYVTLAGKDGNSCGIITADPVTATDIVPAGTGTCVPAAQDVGGWIYLTPLSGGDGFEPGFYRIESIEGGKWRLNEAPGTAGSHTAWWSIPTYGYNTVIMGISGSTFTLRDPPPYYASSGIVGHQSSMLAFGDVETYNNYDDYVFLAETMIGHVEVVNRLRRTNPTYAAYLRWQITNTLPVGHTAIWHRLVYDDPTVTPVDYTAAGLPTIYSTELPTSTGFVAGMSDWSRTSTYTYFLVGNEVTGGFDHATHYVNSYGVKRKGVWLSKAVTGYGAGGIHYPPPRYNECGAGYGSAPFVGWAYHNTIAMQGCGTAIFSGSEPLGPAVLERSDVQTTHFYARGEGGETYQYRGRPGRIFQRDYLYIKPDLILFADYVTYSTAGPSPTTWFLQFTGRPSLSTQRITSTYSTQKIVQDVLLPESPSFTEVSHEAEDLYIKGYHVEVQSGVSASSERFCSAIQVMDSDEAPATVSTLTTTNACVVQVEAIASNPSCVAGCVIGFVSGRTPTLPYSYTYTGSPTAQFLYGHAPSTAYHITRSGSTVTVATATGSGDTTSSADGRLAVP